MCCPRALHTFCNSFNTTDCCHVRGGTYLAGSHVDHAGQLEVLFPNVQLLCPFGGVLLRQLTALLVLNDREQAEGPIVACSNGVRSSLLTSRHDCHASPRCGR